jgi:HD-GYP domain-containing protein (c-di-GMP phosphodiesterase class II)
VEVGKVAQARKAKDGLSGYIRALVAAAVRAFQPQGSADTFDVGAAEVGLLPLARKDQLRALRGFNSMLEAKDPGTMGHSRRVELHALRIGAQMGLSVPALEDLRLAASLHDIGKVGLPDHILNKPSDLTDNEFARVREHSGVGAAMLAQLGGYEVIDGIRHHHERWDGTGYPAQLAGDEIPMFARIIAVADTFDAITSSRPYRSQAGREVAVKVLMEESGRQFDPDCVHAFLMSLPPRIVVTTDDDTFTISTGSR